MRRVIVVGAGFFGGLVARRLCEVGVSPLVATRRGADARLDAEDDRSIDALLRPGDIIVDTAGPFASRTTRLIRAAIERRCDVIDLAESLAWSEAVLALGSRAVDAGVRLYPACSAVAAVTGACIAATGMGAPLEVDQFLAPASAETASPATIAAFMRSLGASIRTLRRGTMVTVPGYADSRVFPFARAVPPPHRRGGLVESAAAALLPLSWPSLRRADLWVNPNMPFGHRALSLAARVPTLAAAARSVAPLLARAHIGRHDGLFAVTVRDGSSTETIVLSARHRSYDIAVEPSVLVAESLAHGVAPAPGIVLPHEQVPAAALFERLRGRGIDVRRERA